MEFEIREEQTLTAELTDAMARLLPQLSPWLAGTSSERLAHLVASPQSLLWSARSEGSIVGVLTLAWYDVPSARKGWIEDVVVDDSVRGKGVGRMLLETALRRAGELGVERMMLTSSPWRHAARALYQSMGFEEAETSVFVLKQR